MSSLQILSPEQRIQQLESTLLSVLTQLADLTSQLQSTQQRVKEMELEANELVSSQAHDADWEELQGRINDHENRLYDLDGGPDEQRNDDSD